jgi:hypothetical protein
MKAVAASLEGRHRAPRGLTGPCGPGRGVGACVEAAQARGSPLRDRVPTGRRPFPGRRPRPSPSGEDRGFREDWSSRKEGPPTKGRAETYSFRVIQKRDIGARGVGGSTSLPAMAFVYTNSTEASRMHAGRVI